MRKPSGLKALPLFERALAITETALGPTIPIRSPAPVI